MSDTFYPYVLVLYSPSGDSSYLSLKQGKGIVYDPRDADRLTKHEATASAERMRQDPVQPGHTVGVMLLEEAVLLWEHAERDRLKR